MISLETTEDGFSVAMDGRVALTHSSRAPLLELGRAETIARHAQGAAAPKERRRSMLKAREWKLVSAHERFIDLEFEGLARVGLREAAGAIHLTLSRYDASFNRFLLRIPSAPDEAVFGCGQRRGALNLKGRRIALWNGARAPEATQGSLAALLARGDQAFPSCQPAFVTDARRYARLVTDARCVFDFRKARVSALGSWAVPEEAVVGFAPSAAEAVGALSALTGRAPVVPGWTLQGACVGVQGGSRSAQEKLDSLRSAGARVGSLCIEDWCGSRDTGQGRRCAWDWRWDEALYPRLPDDIAALARQGIRALGYVSPCLDSDGRLFAEAAGQGFLVKRPDGSDYVAQAHGAAHGAAFGLVDLYSPEAFAWTKSVLRRELLGIGFSGWLADHGDTLPPDVALSGGRDPVAAHNGYADLWARVNAEALREAGKSEDAVFFMRSGWLAAPSLAGGFFPGVDRIDWKSGHGLAGVVPAALSYGLSGGGSWHPTIGGRLSASRAGRDRELLMRWTELGAFSPFMRSSEGYRPDRNLQPWSDPALRAHFARMSGVWADLAPYHRETLECHSREGLPPMRHPWLHYEDEPWLRGYGGQYLYGRDLLVAPVLARGRELSKAALPADRWVHLWTSREFRGGEVTIEAPLGYPPVFYRVDSAWAGLFEGLRRSARR